jgi:hypothetical protein
MDSDGGQFAAIAETTSFLHHFKDLPDHRQAGKVDYPLLEVLLLILLAVLAGAETFTDIARFGERKIELLRRFRPYVNGTPSHDHLGDIFATLDARAFQLCFVAWVAALWTEDHLTAAMNRNLCVRLTPAGARSVRAEHARQRPNTTRASPGIGEERNGTSEGRDQLSGGTQALSCQSRPHISFRFKEPFQNLRHRSRI